MLWICPLITITMMKVAPNLHSKITYVSSIAIIYNYEELHTTCINSFDLICFHLI